MKKTSLFALACAALLSSTAVQAEPKFMFRYVSGGMNSGFQQPEKPTEPEPETPETPENPDAPFDPAQVSIQNFDAQYLPAAGNTTGQVTVNDLVNVSFEIRNDGGVSIDSAAVVISGGGIPAITPSCGQTPIPAHSTRHCSGTLFITQKTIDVLAPGLFEPGASIDTVEVKGETQYVWLGDWKRVILPQDFDLNKHIRITGKKVVWKDNNNNGILDIGDGLGINFLINNDHPSVSLGYIGVDKYLGVLNLFSQSGISGLEADGYKSDGSYNIVSQSTLDKFPKGLNAINGSVVLKTERGNISFSTDNTVEFIVE